MGSKKRLIPSALLTVAVFAATLLAPGGVRADGRYRGGHHGGEAYQGGHRDNDGLWWLAAGALLLSLPLLYRDWRPRPAAVAVQPTPAVVPPEPQVPWYVPARGAMQSAQPSGPVEARSPSWYYCENPSGYYPYVSQCPGGWKTIPAALPPSAPPGP